MELFFKNSFGKAACRETFARLQQRRFADKYAPTNVPDTQAAVASWKSPADPLATDINSSTEIEGPQAVFSLPGISENLELSISSSFHPALSTKEHADPTGGFDFTHPSQSWQMGLSYRLTLVAI